MIFGRFKRKNPHAVGSNCRILHRNVVVSPRGGPPWGGYPYPMYGYPPHSWHVGPVGFPPCRKSITRVWNSSIRYPCRIKWMINVTYRYLITISILNGYRLCPQGLTWTGWGINHISVGGRDINSRLGGCYTTLTKSVLVSISMTEIRRQCITVVYLSKHIRSEVYWEICQDPMCCRLSHTWVTWQKSSGHSMCPWGQVSSQGCHLVLDSSV